jgi:hypothetical protein
MNDADPDALAKLLRWEESGARWRVISRTSSGVVIAMLTCDTGEEVDRLASAGPELLAYVGDRTTGDG